MKILYIIPETYRGPHWGGVTTYTLHLAQAMHERGHDVRVVTPGEPATIRHQSVRISRINPWSGTHRFLSRLYTLCPYIADRLAWMTAVKTFIRTTGPYDIIEAPEWGSSAVLAAQDKGRGRFVVRLHRSTLQYYRDNLLKIPWELPVINVFELGSLLAADGISAPTHFIETTHRISLLLARVFHIPHIIIPNGVPLTSSLHHTAMPFILSVGRLERGKGIPVLLEAFREAHERVPKLTLVLVGEDTTIVVHGKQMSARQYIRRFAASHGLTKHIRSLSPRTQRQLMPLYQSCLLYAQLSSGHENQPMALLDAIRYGKAIVATAAGGIPELVADQKQGMLVPEGDNHAAAQAMVRIATDRILRSRFERENRIIQKRYRIETIASAMEDFYRSIQNPRQRP